MRNYFCGWYLKNQNEHQTVALIPAYHITGGEKSCSLQIITNDQSWNVTFPYEKFQFGDSGVDIGENHFGREGVTLDLHTGEITATGSLSFGPFAPLRYDIMGPFRYVPFLECRHSVYSMKHTVTGHLEINGISYDFRNAVGYTEGDRGRSFPREYVWAQCCFPEGSVMVSVADIPFCGFRFTGVIGAIHYRGKEYRLGTWLGARAVLIHDGEVVIKQGAQMLLVKRLEKKGHPLAAPVGGSMLRTIHETAACKARFCFQKKGKTVFDFVADHVSFEYEYPR